MVVSEDYVLSNGVRIPKVGFGTWLISMEKSKEAAINAINTGYRLFDLGYENQKEIVKGIKATGIKREDIFIGTKINAFSKNYESCKNDIENHLKELELEYLDMLVIHSPEPWTDYKNGNHYFEENKEVWRALEEAYIEGKVRAIGLSNFEISDIENILKNCKIKPMINQILCHISNVPKKLIDFCKDNDILVEAYSPIGHGEILKNNIVVDMAKKYNVSPARLCIRYDLQLGLLPIPKAEQQKYIEDNAKLDFEIDDKDMEILNNIEQIKNYGESSIFPVYGGKMINPEKGEYEARDYKELNNE